MASQAYPPFICPNGRDHRPPHTAGRRRHIKHWLYCAAFHGCVPCVRHCVDVLHVDPKIQSDNMNYTALHWAEWGVQQPVPGAAEVVAYVRLLSS